MYDFLYLSSKRKTAKIIITTCIKRLSLTPQNITNFPPYIFLNTTHHRNHFLLGHIAHNQKINITPSSLFATCKRAINKHIPYPFNSENFLFKTSPNPTVLTIKPFNSAKYGKKTVYITDSSGNWISVFPTIRLIDFNGHIVADQDLDRGEQGRIVLSPLNNLAAQTSYLVIVVTVRHVRHIFATDEYLHLGTPIPTLNSLRSVWLATITRLCHGCNISPGRR
jgi:hypothetical protein